jgi:hypothetical protein
MRAEHSRISEICLRAKALAEEIAHKARDGRCSREELDLLTDSMSQLEQSLHAVASVLAALETTAETPIQDTLSRTLCPGDAKDAGKSATDEPK